MSTTYLRVVEEAPHEVRLRAPVIPHPVLAEPAKVVRVDVGSVQREGAVECRQGFLAFPPIPQLRAKVGKRFLVWTWALKTRARSGCRHASGCLYTLGRLPVFTPKHNTRVGPCQT